VRVCAPRFALYSFKYFLFFSPCMSPGKTWAGCLLWAASARCFRGLTRADDTNDRTQDGAVWAAAGGGPRLFAPVRAWVRGCVLAYGASEFPFGIYIP
jgi:hypothetical protein